ncbi:hypothetical protein ACFW3D_14825 [Streptomyces sp. NPDC058864]
MQSETSATASVRAADAAERSAAADEAALAEQRRLAEEQRAAAEEAARPRVDLVLEHVNRKRFRVRNCGTAVAEGVVLEQVRNLVGYGGEPATLDAGQSFSFLLTSAMGMPMPDSLQVRWTGQEEPVSLPVPPAYI